MFSTKYQDIIIQIERINPLRYSRTRSKLDGAVTRLSPYLTRGVISLPQVRDMVLEKYSKEESAKFIQELAWREYFQKVYIEKGDAIFRDIRCEQLHVEKQGIPKCLSKNTLGIRALDQSIQDLVETGYMHNAMRMSVASIVCNLGRYAWLGPSRWMYYHLLDGDVASNSLSWQWVAGTSRQQIYTTNQDLIDYISNSKEQGTYLDFDRDVFSNQPTPEILQASSSLDLYTHLPEGDSIVIDPHLDTLLYHPWHLDPAWRSEKKANRIMIVEPSHFEKHPVSHRVIDFIIALGRENIPALQIYVGEVGDLALDAKRSYTREHPCANNFPGHIDPREWLFPQVRGYYKNFFAFWKECEKHF